MGITVVPSVVTGQTYSAANYNTQVRDNINGIWVLTTAGDMLYATGSAAANRLALVTNGIMYGGASAPAWLAPPAGKSIMQFTTLPAWLAIGSAYQVLRVNAAANGFEFAHPILMTKVGLTAGNHNVGIVAWNSEIVDDLAGHDNSSNNSRITVPAAGRYMPIANIAFWTPTGGALIYYTSAIYVNGAEVFNKRDMVYHDASVTSLLPSTTPLILSANDYVEVYADLHGSKVLYEPYCFFTLLKIG